MKIQTEGNTLKIPLRELTLEVQVYQYVDRDVVHVYANGKKLHVNVEGFLSAAVGDDCHVVFERKLNLTEIAKWIPNS